MPVSSSASDPAAPVSGSEPDSSADWPLMPTETEIYILPDGQVVIADLPAELSDLVDQLGDVESCAVEPAVMPGAESDAPARAPSSPHEDA